MALVSLCDTGLIGLILMFLSVSLSGLLFTALVWCNSHTWIYFKHKGRYIKVDDQVQHNQNGQGYIRYINPKFLTSKIPSGSVHALVDD